jgi:hypothetical protein
MFTNSQAKFSLLLMHLLSSTFIPAFVASHEKSSPPIDELKIQEKDEVLDNFDTTSSHALLATPE